MHACILHACIFQQFLRHRAAPAGHPPLDEDGEHEDPGLVVGDRRGDPPSAGERVGGGGAEEEVWGVREVRAVGFDFDGVFCDEGLYYGLNAERE